MKVNTTHASLAIVSLAIGVMFSIQLSTNLHSSTPKLSFKQWSEQEKLIKDYEEKNKVLLNEVVELRTQLTNKGLKNDDNRELKEKLNQANNAAGFTTVMGPGVVITLEDNPDPLLIGDNPADYIIHDKNILSVINQLKISGAEAISINDQRIIATSEVRCAGPTILVNLNRLSPPYEIKAIGRADTLEESMRSTGGELYILGLRGIKTSIQKASNIEIQAYNGLIKYSYAQPNNDTGEMTGCY